MKKIVHFFIFVVQFCFYWLLFPIAKLLYGNKRVWIVCERGDDARDNGYFMFKYLRAEHQYVNIYYLIKKKSVDYNKVKPLGKVVGYKSFKHWLLYIAAEVRMTTHLAAFAPGNFVGEWFKRHKQSGVNVYLQHGITHNEFLCTYNKYNGSDIFVCGAKDEFNFVSQKCGYPKGNVVYTGFSRFDNLHDCELKKQILIMPTWRSYLRDINTTDFTKSKYFESWSFVLQNNELINYCRSKGIEVVFYPHYSLQHFVHEFDKFSNDVVKIADFDHYDVQTLLKESSLLITDYSSILFDFAYMRKPELLYQFDEDEFYGKHYQRSYFDHRDNGFGKVVTSKNDVIASIISVCENDFKLDKIFENRIKAFFPLYDANNSERIYQEIVKKFISKKKKHLSAKDLNVVITGDDYGRNEESSKGILKALEKGYINKASVIVNKKCDCEPLYNVLDKKNCALHFNITEGYASFGDQNEYLFSVNEKNSVSNNEIVKRNSFFKLSDNAKQIISNEINGEIDLFKKLGYECYCFDSHGHTHNKMPIAKIIVPILKANNFEYCRIPQNVSKRHILFYLFYTKRVIRFYKKNFKTPDYFCSADDFIHIKHYRKYRNKVIEIMTHPFVDENDRLFNRRDIDFETIVNGVNKS